MRYVQNEILEEISTEIAMDYYLHDVGALDIKTKFEMVNEGRKIRFNISYKNTCKYFTIKGIQILITNSVYIKHLDSEEAVQGEIITIFFKTPISYNQKGTGEIDLMEIKPRKRNGKEYVLTNLKYCIGEIIVEPKNNYIKELVTKL